MWHSLLVALYQYMLFDYAYIFIIGYLATAVRYLQTSDIRRCSNCIFILDLTPCFNRLTKDSYQTRRETFQCWDFVRHILEVWRYVRHQFLSFTFTYRTCIGCILDAYSIMSNCVLMGYPEGFRCDYHPSDYTILYIIEKQINLT